jgi:1-acyl-sn-glycerol-3-phosphate acyltransferase
MARAGRQIKEGGLHLMLFAEGTRSSDGRLQPFKKGPFVLAIEGEVPLVPVSIVGSRPIMPKGSFRIGRGNIVVRIGKPISATGLEHSDRDRLRKTVRDAVVRLRGGEGRTSYLAGEVALGDVVGTQSTLSP